MILFLLHQQSKRLRVYFQFVSLSSCVRAMSVVYIDINVVQIKSRFVRFVCATTLLNTHAVAVFAESWPSQKRLPPMDSCGCTSPGVNPNDPAWQKNKDFPSNKAKEWNGRTHFQDYWWMQQHSIRSGLQDFHAAIRAVYGRHEVSKWEAGILKTAWTLHSELVGSMLKNYKGVLLPFLQERINFNGKRSPNMVDGVVQTLDGVNVHIKSIESTKVTFQTLKSLFEAFEKHRTNLEQFLEDADEMDLPLMRAFFTPTEATVVVQQLLGTMADVEVGSLVFYADEDGVSQFMQDANISWFSWFFSMKKKRDDFEINFVQPLAFVTRGVPLSTCGCNIW